jgi:hypothetical protein
MQALTKQWIIILSMEREIQVISEGQNFLYIRELYQWLRVYVLSDRMSCIVLGSRGCNNVVLNAHAATDSTSDDLEERFYE